VSQTLSATAAASPATGVLKVHRPALRRYVRFLLGADGAPVDEVVRAAEEERAAAAGPEDESREKLYAVARRRALAHPEAADPSTEAAGSGGDADDNEPVHATVLRLLGRLTLKQQEATRLKFQHGFDFPAIGRLLALPPSGAGTLVHQAVTRIGRVLARRSAGAVESGDGPDDPRLTALALDELDSRESRTFAAQVTARPGGEAQLAHIREWSAALAQALAIEAGAPAPARRKRRRSGRGDRTGKHALTVVGLIVLGAGYWFGPRSSAEADDQSGGRMATDGQREVRTRAADPSPAPGHYGPGYGSGDGAPGFAARSPLRKSPSASLAMPPRVTASEKAESGPAAVVRPATLPAARPQGETSERPAEEPPAAARGGTPSSDPESTGTALEPGRPRPGRSGDAPGRGRPGSGEANDFTVNVGPVPGSAAEPGSAAAPDRPGESARDLPAPLRRPAGLKELRALLASGRWPEPGQVSAAALAREAAPRGAGGGGPAPVTAALEVVRSPFRPEESLARLVVSARDPAAVSRPAANLVLVIDVSRSMAGPNRLPLVGEAVGRLLERLQPDDAITLVTYAAAARELLPATPVRRAAAIRAALAGLEAEGLTNGSDGLLLGYACAERRRTDAGVNAVILCTDGNFNLGLVTPEALAAPVEEHRRRGLRLHVFGFGRTDRNDPRLELLAVRGGGRSGYVNTPEEAGALLVAQVEGLFAPVASEVAVRATFPRELGTALHSVDPAAATAAPGEEFPVWDTALLRSGEARAGLYRLTGPCDPAPPPVAVRLAYRDAVTGVRRTDGRELDGRPLDPARASPEARFALAVTEFARLLGSPPSPRTPQDLENVHAWGRAALGADAGGYQAEFLALVEQAQAVARAAVK